MTTKYYKYITEPPHTHDLSLEYGKVWIYKIEATTGLQKYSLSIFSRKDHIWYELCSIDHIPEQFKLLNKKELFLNLL